MRKVLKNTDQLSTSASGQTLPLDFVLKKIQEVLRKVECWPIVHQETIAAHNFGLCLEKYQRSPTIMYYNNQF